MREEIADIAAIADPLARAKAAGEASNRLMGKISDLATIRREAVLELLSQGQRQTTVAKALGVTRARLNKLINNAPASDRAFFGAGSEPRIVAVGEKVSAGKPEPVVSTFDVSVRDHLRALLGDLGFTSEFEIIKPPGSVRLNRDGLIIICGPRLSPLIAQILEADDALGFGKDAEGWYLIDRRADEIYRSAQDSDHPGDTAYLGRLPRPDGRGHFLYIAGIHAAGAAGAVHYLEHELTTLHREVRGRRFSVLISCSYDPNTREVIASERVSPLYKHEG